jgi:hypothetical protein
MTKPLHDYFVNLENQCPRYACYYADQQVRTHQWIA